MIAVAVVAFALFNALGEELLWRAVVPAMTVVDSRSWRTAITAASFGLAHLNGIPSGPLGVVAAAVYSVLLTRIRTRLGFSSAFSAHFVTDLVLFAVAGASASYAFSFASSAP